MVTIKRTPDTNAQAVTGQRAQAFPLDYSPLIRGFESLHAQVKDDILKTQQFDLTARLLKETHDMETAFEAKKTDPNSSPYSMADDFDQEAQARHQLILDEYAKQGYDKGLLTEFSNKLAAVRNDFWGQGLQFQAHALKSKAVQGLGDYGDSLGQTVVKDPNAYGDAIDSFKHELEQNPYLEQTEKDTLLEQTKNNLVEAGGKSIAYQRPEFVLQTLDPEGRFRTPGPALVTGSASSVVAKPGSWQSVATTVADKLQLDPVDVASVFGYETAGTFDPTKMGGKGGKYKGLIQFGPDEQKKYGITDQSTPEDWSNAIVKFATDRGFKPGMGLRDFYSTINAGSPGHYNASDGNGTVDQHVQNIINRRDKGAEWLQQGAVQAVDVPPSSAPQSAPIMNADGTVYNAQPGEAAQTAAAFDSLAGKTGVRLFDEMNGQQRLNTISLANERLKQNEASQKAAMDILINNYTNEALTSGGLPKGQKPTEQEVLQTYGPVEGPQKWAMVEQAVPTGSAMLAFRTMSQAAIETRLNGIAPQPGDPAYAVKAQMYQAAQQAATQLLSERQQDPAAYVLKYFPEVAKAAAKADSDPAHYYASLDRAYQQLGIDPNTVSPMPEASTQKFLKEYPSMNPAQKLDFMLQNYGTMGETRFKNFMDSLKGTTAGRDAYIYAMLRETNQAGAHVLRDNATQIFQDAIEGLQIIAKDPARRPSAKIATANYTDNIGSALGNLGPDMSNAISEAAIGLYVLRGGAADGTSTAIYQQALKDVLGGSLPVSLGHGNASDYTILPRGVSEDKFVNWKEHLVPRQLTKMSIEGLPPVYADGKTEATVQDIIDGATFVMVAPSQYALKMSSDGGFLKTKTGNNFIVTIKPGDIK